MGAPHSPQVMELAREIQSFERRVSLMRAQALLLDDAVDYLDRTKPNIERALARIREASDNLVRMADR